MSDPRRRVAILTRRPEDNAPLADRLRAAGIEVIELPCVRTQPLQDLSALATAIGALDRADWLVVTSRAGADAVARVARPRSLVAAIGRVTAARLEAHGITVDFQPRIPSGSALGRELPLAPVALLARSDRALPDLPAILRSRGFAVREVVAYRTVARAEGDIARVREALSDPARDVQVHVTSPSEVEAFADAVGGLAARATFHVSGSPTEALARARVASVRIVREEEVDLDVARQ